MYNLMFHAVYLVITCCHIDLHRENLYSKVYMKSSKGNGLNCAICIIAASGTQCRCKPFFTVRKIFNLKTHTVSELLLCPNALFVVLDSR